MRVMELQSDYDSTVSWARKTRSYPAGKSYRQSLMWAEFRVLRNAREEHAGNIMRSQEQPANWRQKDMPHVDKTLHKIDFDMQFAIYGDVRNYIKENPV